MALSLALAACSAGQPASPGDAGAAGRPPASTDPAALALTVTPTATPEPGPVVIVAVGDVMMGRLVNKLSIARDDYTWPFAKTRDVLAGADLTLGNLEAPLVEGCSVKGSGLRLCADPRAVEGLTYAGFDVLSLVNNHALDYGVDGLNTTIEALRQAGIQPVTGGQVVHLTIHGLRIGIMGFLDIDRDLDIEAARQVVAEEAPKVDLLIGIMHWGYELQANESPRQRLLAHTLIDAGMKIIFGAHPHVLQAYERYHGGMVFYSLGNFVFDSTNNRRQDTRESIIVRLTLRPEGGAIALDEQLFPVRIQDYGQPNPVEHVPVPTMDP